MQMSICHFKLLSTFVYDAYLVEVEVDLGSAPMNDFQRGRPARQRG